MVVPLSGVDQPFPNFPPARHTAERAVTGNGRPRAAHVRREVLGNPFPARGDDGAVHGVRVRTVHERV